MSGLSLLLSHLLAAYAAVGEPVLGARMYERLTSEVVHDGGARVRFYRMSMVIEWSWVLAVGLILVSGGLPFGGGAEVGEPPDDGRGIRPRGRLRDADPRRGSAAEIPEIGQIQRE